MEQSLILGYFRNRFLPVTEKDECVVRLELLNYDNIEPDLKMTN